MTNCAVYFLRAKQIGLTLGEMEEIDMGLVFDLLIESGNDGQEYPNVATQADIDRL